MRRERKMTLCFMAFALVMGLATATAFHVNAEAKVKVKSVKVSAPYAKTAYVAKGKSIKIAPVVSVTPSKSANKKVTFSAKNKKVASVSSSGVIKGKKVGKTKVVVTSKKNKKKKVTITVKVMAKAVTKVTLNKKTASVVAGKTLTLTKKVTPSASAGKVVKWTTSNKKIATVTSKGIVKGIKAGKATIKATAADGSKKSAKCVVTVKSANQVDIKSIEVMDSDTIMVTLNRAKALSVSDFSIQSKATPNGKYVRTYEVKGASSLDFIVYMVRVDDLLVDYNYLKVTINGLDGVKSKEIMIKYHTKKAGLPESVITGKVDENISQRQIDFGSYITGEATYSATGLPAGFYTKVDTYGNFNICGKSSSVLDNVIATVTATDETGKSVSKNIRFLVGSKTQLVAYVEPMTILSNQIYSQGVSKSIYIAGGNGSYTVTSTMDDSLKKMEYVKDSAWSRYYTFYVNSKYNESTKKYETPSFPAGNYSTSLQIEDSDGVSVTRKMEIKAVDGTTLSGYLRDAEGEPIANQHVYAYCTSANDISINMQTDKVTDATGRYSIRVIGGQSYTVSSMLANKYDVEVPATGGMTDLRSPMYKVTVNMNAPGASKFYGGTNYYDQLNNDNASKYHYIILNDVNEYEEREREINPIREGITYLLPGTYSLTTKATDYEYNESIGAYDANDNLTGMYDIDFTVTVGDKNQTIAVTPTPCKTIAMTVGTPVDIKLEKYETVFLEYTRPDNKSYSLTSDALPKNSYIEVDGDEFDEDEKVDLQLNTTIGVKQYVKVENAHKSEVTIKNLCINEDVEE